MLLFWVVVVAEDTFFVSFGGSVVRKLRLLLLLGFLGSLGDLAGDVFESDGLDDTDGHGLTHVTYGETTKGRELLEGLYAHGLAWHQVDDGGVTGLDGLGVLLGGLTGTTVALLLDLCEFAGDVGGVTIEHRRVTVADLTGVVEDNDLEINNFIS